MASTSLKLRADRSTQSSAAKKALSAKDLVTMRGAADQAAELLKSIGSTHRLMILCMLMDGEKTVSEICSALEARQSLVSQHLLRLRQDRLVCAERRGHFVYYSLNDTPARDIIAILHARYCPTVMSKKRN